MKKNKTIIFFAACFLSLNTHGQNNYKWMEHNSIHIGCSINKYFTIGYMYQNKLDYIIGLNLQIPSWQDYVGKKTNVIKQSYLKEEGKTNPLCLNTFWGLPISINTALIGEVGIGLEKDYTSFVDKQEWYYSINNKRIVITYGLGFKVDFSPDLYFIVNYNIHSGIGLSLGFDLN